MPLPPAADGTIGKGVPYWPPYFKKLDAREIRRKIKQDVLEEALEEWEGVEIADATVISLAENAEFGDEFKRLMSGDWEKDFESQSEADYCLCRHLLYFSGKNLAQTDKIFRSSGLMRDKWDERRGFDETYGSRTIKNTAKALKSIHTGKCLDGFDPKEDDRSPVDKLLDELTLLVSGNQVLIYKDCYDRKTWKPGDDLYKLYEEGSIKKIYANKKVPVISVNTAKEEKISLVNPVRLWMEHPKLA
jgi:hypothetical protein